MKQASFTILFFSQILPFDLIVHKIIMYVFP